MRTRLFALFFAFFLAAGAEAQQKDSFANLVPPEGGKRPGTTVDRDTMISQINTFIESYRLVKGWDTSLTQHQLEEARSQAFLLWAQDHHGDLDKGSKLAEVFNKELSSNLGTVDLDWLATMGNRGILAQGPLGDVTYLAGKAFWFLGREEEPDLSSFHKAFPDTNWRAVAIADLLLSGKASVEEIFISGRQTKLVTDRDAQLQSQQRFNEKVPIMDAALSAAKPVYETVKHELKPDSASQKIRMGLDTGRDLGGVTMTMNVDANSFTNANTGNLSDYLCLSLKALSLAAKSELSAGNLSQGVAWLSGMTKIHAIAPDRQNQDLVLVGEAVFGETPIHLDDVVVLLRNAFSRTANPYCSLDPKPKNILRLNKLFEQLESVEIADNFDTFLNRVRDTAGPQTVVVGGVPRTSRAAHIMINADYEMKQLSQGLIPASNILRSVLDRHILSAKSAIISSSGNDETGSSMARFWFCMAPNQPSFGTNLAGVIWLEQCSVAVRTERQLATASGKLVDSHNAPDADAEAFATEFTENYPQISKLYPSMRALENLFRFQALFTAASYQSVLKNADVAFLRDNYPLQAATAMPDSLPGLANGRVERWSTPPAQGRVMQYTLAPVISGGVDLSARISPQRVLEASPQQSELCAKALLSRPNPSVVFWRLTL